MDITQMVTNAQDVHAKMIAELLDQKRQSDTWELACANARSELADLLKKYDQLDNDLAHKNHALQVAQVAYDDVKKYNTELEEKLKTCQESLEKLINSPPFYRRYFRTLCQICSRSRSKIAVFFRRFR